MPNWLKRFSRKRVQASDDVAAAASENPSRHSSQPTPRIAMSQDSLLDRIQGMRASEDVPTAILQKHTQRRLQEEDFNKLVEIRRSVSEHSSIEHEIQNIQLNPAAIPRVSNVEYTPPSTNTYRPPEELHAPCAPATCRNDCPMCSLNAKLDCKMAKKQKSKKKKDSLDRPSKVQFHSQSHITLSELALTASHPSFSQIDKENVFSVSPVLDKQGKPMKFTEAIGEMMKRGIIETSLTKLRESKTEVLKATTSLSSSSEASNVGMVRGEWDLSDHALHDKLAAYPFAKRKAKSDTSAAQREMANNTSIHYVHPTDAFDDSMVQLKFRNQLNEGSCTQYFALRSPMQLEAYAQAHRGQQRRASKAKQAETEPHLSDDIVVPHQKGMMQLSVASIVQEQMALPTDAEAGTGPPLSKEEEAVVRVVDLAQQSGEEKMSFASNVTALADAASAESNAVVVDSLTKSREKVASDTGCQRCKLQRDFRTTILRPRSTSDGMPNRGTIPRGDVGSILFHGNSDDIKLRSESDIAANFNDRKSRYRDAIEMDDHADIPSEQFLLVIRKLIPSPDLLNYSAGPIGSAESVDRSPSFVFKWNFLRQADSFALSTNEMHEGKPHTFNCIKSYELEISPAVYQYLSKCSIPLELYYVHYMNETLIGKCNLRIGRCFADVSKIYECAMDINNRDLTYCFEHLTLKHFGQLVCRYHMRGEQARFDACRPPPIHYVPIPPLIETDEFSPSADVPPHLAGVLKDKRQVVQSSTAVSEAELQAFQEGLNLVLVRNKALRTTQEDITNELKERTSWMHEELKWRLTLQENAILCGKDPNLVKWRQWKDEATANVRYRPIAYEEFFKDGRAHIEIEIQELLLHGDCKAMNDDNLTHIYIEYAFLKWSGPSMETPTIRKPSEEKTMRFKFNRVFDIDVDTPEAKTLAEMIKNNESIPFTIISQPIEDMKDLQCCYDFAVANLVLFDLLQSRNNVAVENVPVVEQYNKDRTIGHLRIKFTGVLAMRSMALHILTPETFKIIR